MKARDLFAFSASALAGHRLRSVLALLGVVIGVASVIVLTSLGEGARLYVVNEFAELGTNLVVVFPGKVETSGFPITGGTPRDLTLDDLHALRKQVPAVRHMAPISMGEADATVGDRSRRATIIGTTADLLFIRHLSVQIGRFLPTGDVEHAPRVAVIGAKIQRELFGDTNPLGEVVHVGNERYRIIGVLAPRGMSMGMDLDEAVVLPVNHAMRMFNQRGLFRIVADVGMHEQIPASQNAILRVLEDRHGGEDVTILTEDAVLDTLGSILAVLTAALGGIAAISLVVAGVAIMNVMLVSVSERTSEIGLLKALGATPGNVVAAFLAEAALLSSTGGILGLGVGFGTCAGLRLLWPSFPIHAPTWAVVSALVVSVGVGLIFGALPARKAAGLDPVTCLQKR